MSILASLARAYDRLPDVAPFGFSAEKIGVVIGLNDDGTVASVSDVRDLEGKRPTPRVMHVPQPVRRTAGIASNFLWDKTSYALGVTAGAGKRVAEEHAAFVKRHLTMLKDIDDVGLVALRRFLESWTPHRFVPPLFAEAMKDQNVVFALESERRLNVYVHDRPASKVLWATLGSASDDEGNACLITGERGPTVRLHPAIKGVWGAQTAGASLVSFNLDAFTSYGHEQGDNAPISQAAAFKYAAALNTYLAGRKNRLQIGDASTIFWADASNADLAQTAESIFAGMWSSEQGTEEEQQLSRAADVTAAGKVAAILQRIRTGTPLEDLDPGLAEGVRFHVLGLAPNAARLSVRFWLEDTFGSLAANYQRFAADMQIEPPPRNPYPPLWMYLVETAVLRKRENVPSNLAGEWMRAILTGTKYPLTLLSTVLMRLRADKNVNPLRVAMLRALLVRNFHMDKEAPMSLDPENREKGYLLGRLFATYEWVQTAALGRGVNATIKDKYFGAASAQPRTVFSTLGRGAATHLSKLGKSRPGQKVNLDRTIAEIMEAIAPDDPFPAFLNASQQALFGLGYYHQRSDFFRKPEALDQGETDQ